MNSQPSLSKRVKSYFKSYSGDIRYIFAPFIQRDTIERVLPQDGSDTIVITRWRRDDLRMGVSDPQVYEFCKNHDYTLKINHRLHAKVYSWDLDNAIVGSANLTNSGMEEGLNTNIEVLTRPLELPTDTQLKLRVAENESQLVTEAAYQQALEISEEAPMHESDERSIDIKDPPEFLTSQLPTTEDPEIIVSVLASNHDLSLSELPPELRRCVLHDVASYSLDDLRGLHEDEVRAGLQQRFEEHPFIKEIIDNMDPEIYFGEMKELVQRKCIDVPTPSRRELTEDVKLLYTWFQDISSDHIVHDIPGAHSERLRNIRWNEGK